MEHKDHNHHRQQQIQRPWVMDGRTFLHAPHTYATTSGKDATMGVK